jgi:N-acetylneuraminic acid mutarotase
MKMLSPGALRLVRTFASAAGLVVVSHSQPPLHAQTEQIADTASCNPRPWTTGATGPAARYRAGGVSDGRYVYVFGGGNATGGYLNDLWRWDPGTETWTQLANMPTAKQNIQGAYFSGKIYVPGGFNGAHLTENAIYDVASNTWSTGAPLAAAQSGTTVAYNGRIYVFGGNPGPTTATRIYDIASNSWSTGANMPVGITYGRAVVAGNFAYYVGGIIGSTITAAVYRYDFAINSWATVASMQTVRATAEIAVSPDGSKIYAIGGGGSGFFNAVPTAQSVEIYTIASNTWSYGHPLPTSVSSPSGGFALGKLMVQGGVNGTVYYDTGQVSGVVCPSCVPNPQTWRNAATAPLTRYRAGSVSDGRYIYVFGGGNATGGFLNDLWRWDPATKTWTQLANMPTAKQNVQGAYWNGKIYVPGGFTGGGHITENAIYDIATNTWSTGAPLPAAQTGANVATNGKIYNFGGNPNAQTTTTIYDIPTNTWSNGAAMPGGVTFGRAVAVGNFAYYVGGIAGGTSSSNVVYRYDLTANTWSSVAPMQTARASAEVAASPDGTKIYAIGGGGPGSAFFTAVPLAQSVEIYDIPTNTWSYGAPLLTTAAAPAGGIARGLLMVQGGISGTTYYDQVQISNVACAPAVASAVSRKSHGAAGVFNIALPLTGAAGVESRRGTGTTLSDHVIVVSFEHAVSIAGLTLNSSAGSPLASATVDGSTLTISLSSVADAQRVTINLLSVSDGTNSGDIALPIELLIGDVNGDRVVNSGDALQTRNRSGQATDATNFRADVNTDGNVNSGDAISVRSRSGNFLP